MDGTLGLVILLVVVVISLLFAKATPGKFDDFGSPGQRLQVAFFGMIALGTVLYIVQYQFWVLALRAFGQLEHLPTFIAISQAVGMCGAAALFLAIGIKRTYDMHFIVPVKVIPKKTKMRYSFVRYLRDVANTIGPIMLEFMIVGMLYFLWTNAVLFTPLH